MPDTPTPAPTTDLLFAMDHLREALRHATIARATILALPFCSAYHGDVVASLQQAIDRLVYLVGPLERL